MLYQHVHLLRRNGYGVTALHEKESVQTKWLDFDVAETSLQARSFKPNSNDILVIPEVCASSPVLGRISCRKLVFVQGSFLMLSNLEQDENYRTLGFERALVTMPHMKPIVENYFKVSASIIPAFVAPYFFLDQETLLTQHRSRSIIIYPKFGYVEAGLPDYDIVSRLLRRRLDELRESSVKWELKELKNLTHREAARLMQDSIFFVNVNSLEGFNATVPEAMAAGCIPICYDAYGGCDFLHDGLNAHVFPNHHAYPLLDKIFDLMNRYDQMQDEILQMKKNAHATASQFTEKHTEQALLDFYRSYIA